MHLIYVILLQFRILLLEGQLNESVRVLGLREHDVSHSPESVKGIREIVLDRRILSTVITLAGTPAGL